VTDQRVLLLDDVATSGATLTAAASCLKRSGATTVTAAVVARTPRPGEGTVTRSKSESNTPSAVSKSTVCFD
jgi:adenine/guanine phosphoribosyltransferase-like PRPP-binding protein